MTWPVIGAIIFAVVAFIATGFTEHRTESFAAGCAFLVFAFLFYFIPKFLEKREKRYYDEHKNG